MAVLRASAAGRGRRRSPPRTSRRCARASARWASRRRSSGCTRRRPALLEVVRASGLELLEAPLMVLDRAVWRAPEPPSGITLRVLDADDGALAAARAVQNVSFGAAGTAAGPEGLTERDAATDEDGLEFTARAPAPRAHRDGRGRGSRGPVAAGMHQPVEGVSEVVGVATLPAVRRQGLGGAVTGALVEDALDARGDDGLPDRGQRGHRAGVRAARLPAHRLALRGGMRPRARGCARAPRVPAAPPARPARPAASLARPARLAAPAQPRRRERAARSSPASSARS